jgi:hypothetical protein
MDRRIFLPFSINIDMDKRQASRRKYHYLYVTVCKVTFRYYIGMHSTDNLEDGYIGSGTRLWRSINKHGRENHVLKILEFLPDRESLKAFEKLIVNEETLKDPQCMNLKYGGEGGWHLTPEQRSVIGKIGGKAFARRLANDPILAQKYIAYGRIRAANMKSLGIQGCAGGDLLKEMIKRAQSSKAIEKRKETFKKLGHQQGELNSQYGKLFAWVNKDQKVLKIPLDELQSRLDGGWLKGIKPPKVISSQKVSRKNFSKLNCLKCGIEFECSQRDIRRNRKFCGLKCFSLRNVSVGD